MTPGLGRVSSREAPPPQSEASGGSTGGTRRPPGGPRPSRACSCLAPVGLSRQHPRNAPDAPVLGRRECSPLFRSREDCASSVPQGPGVVRPPAQNGGPQREEGPVAPGQKTGHRPREGGKTGAEKSFLRTEAPGGLSGWPRDSVRPGGSFLLEALFSCWAKLGSESAPTCVRTLPGRSDPRCLLRSLLCIWKGSLCGQ